MGIILWIGWLYGLYRGVSNRRFILSAIVLIAGVAVNFTPLGNSLGVAAVPIWIGLTIILLIVNQFDSGQHDAGWLK